MRKLICVGFLLVIPLIRWCILFTPPFSVILRLNNNFNLILSYIKVKEHLLIEQAVLIKLVCGIAYCYASLRDYSKAILHYEQGLCLIEGNRNYVVFDVLYVPLNLIYIGLIIFLA